MTISAITYEHVGFYSCKAKNEIGEAVTLGKVELSSQTVKHDEAETIETNEKKIQQEVQFSKGGSPKKITHYEDLAQNPAILKILKTVNAEQYGPGTETIKELKIIEYLIQQGSTIQDIKETYNSNGFRALKQPQSQFALVQLMEREGHGKIITEILVAEHIADDELLASTVGFLAFLAMIDKGLMTMNSVISLLSHEDFTRQEWKSIEARD